MKADVSQPDAPGGSASPASSHKPAYLEYLDGFRGLAILFVVLIHANNAMLQRGVERTEGEFSWVWTFFHILSHNSTVYFALISGVLYAYHLRSRPHGAFLRSRFEAVIVPYVLVSAVLTLLFAGFAAVRSGELPGVGTVAREIAFNVLTGEAWNHLWYIPVIAVLYVVSPLLLRAIEYPGIGKPVATILVFLPLVFSRTGTEITVSMLVYFAGVYTIGLLIGRDPEGVLSRLSRQVGAIALAALLAAGAVWFIDAHDLDLVGPTSSRESAIFVLRIALALLGLIWLRANYAALGPAAKGALGQVAAYSFGIYFLHAPLLRPIVRVLGPLVPEGNPSWALIAGIIVSFFVSLLASMAIVRAIKWAAGEKSKFIIGS